MIVIDFSPMDCTRVVQLLEYLVVWSVSAFVRVVQCSTPSWRGTEGVHSGIDDISNFFKFW